MKCRLIFEEIVKLGEKNREMNSQLLAEDFICN